MAIATIDCVKRLLAFGGASPDLKTIFNSIEFWDDSSEEWILMTNLQMKVASYSFGYASTQTYKLLQINGNHIDEGTNDCNSDDGDLYELLN